MRGPAVHAIVKDGAGRVIHAQHDMILITSRLHFGERHQIAVDADNRVIVAYGSNSFR